MRISNRVIDKSHGVYFVAELSANHSGNLETALQTVKAAKASGADAIKLQTYTAATMTLNEDHAPFLVEGGTPWDGRKLYDLYDEAHTPWEWHEKIQKAAKDIGLDFFSAGFDATAVDFLETLNVPVHKIASFELTDHPLIRKMASTGKPLILSTGLASEIEIEEAVNVAKTAGCKEYILLKCTSAYPAPAKDANLSAISYFEKRFQCPIGLSDHTLGTTVPVVAATLGACMIEKHFILNSKIQSPDSSFSLLPHEFETMVKNVKLALESVGTVKFGGTEKSESYLKFRRSLWIAKPVKKGEVITSDHVRSLRPNVGLSPKHLDAVIGKTAAEDLSEGTALDWEHLK